MKRNKLVPIFVVTLLFSLMACNTPSHQHTYNESWNHDEIYHWHDATCGHEVVSDKDQHIFKDVVTPATYEKNGFTTHTCIICGYSYTDSETRRLINLYDANSKYYMRTLTDKDSIASLRTFHHKDYDDVPFVDMNEYHYAVKPYIERNRMFYQGESDHEYVYSRIEGTGKMVFDTSKNTVSIINPNAFYYDTVGTNNGIDGDITNNNIKLYTSSDKTKVLEQGHDIVINLNDYNMDIVSQDNHLYVPINFVNTILMGPVNAGVCYNGADFFSDAAMRNTYTSVYARSGNYNSSWIFTISEAPTALKKVDNVLSDEIYRFQGILSSSTADNQIVVTLSLFNDHKGTMNAKNGIHYAFNWSEDDKVINLTGAQTFMESRDLDDAISDTFFTMINKRETNYGLGKRSVAVAKIGYDELRLSFDYTYGLKEKLDVTKLISENTELKNALLSEDIMVYEDAFNKLINHYIDDIHSTMNGGESVYSSSPTNGFILEKNKEYQGDRNKAYYEEVSRLGNMKSSSGNLNAYAISGDTAYIRFHLFIHSTSDRYPITGYNNAAYKTASYEEAQTKVMAALNDCPYYAFCVAFNDILKHDNIKNIVIDITGNIGGEVRCIPYLAAFMTIDPCITYKNTMDGSLLDFHYKVDLNGDGTYGGDGDTFQGKYNFYILNGANFSAGNEFATLAKNCGYAKLLGEKSSGGSCAVSNRVDSSGMTYRLSSPINLQLKQGDTYITNDGGVDVDYVLPFDNWFDLDKLDAFLKTIQQ